MTGRKDENISNSKSRMPYIVTAVIAALLIFIIVIIVIVKGNISQKAAKGFINNEGYYVFGTYEQDGDESNGPEPIEWVILDDNENGTLLLSRYVLDCVPYNTADEDVTWETSGLRSWMNNDFYNAAFDDDEKANINTVTVVNEDNPKFGTPGGNDTSDKVFCLSVPELLEYYDFNSWEEDNWKGFSQELITPPTKYAEGRGVWLSVAPYEDRMESVRKTLELGRGLSAFALIALGYPDGNRPRQDRFDESRIHYID